MKATGFEPASRLVKSQLQSNFATPSCSRLLSSRTIPGGWVRVDKEAVCLPKFQNRGIEPRTRCSKHPVWTNRFFFARVECTEPKDSRDRSCSRSLSCEGWYFTGDSTRAGANASSSPTYATHRREAMQHKVAERERLGPSAYPPAPEQTEAVPASGTGAWWAGRESNPRMHNALVYSQLDAIVHPTQETPDRGVIGGRVDFSPHTSSD